MVKIAFYSNVLNERGTTVALYDYAYYNEILLNNESIIITKSIKKCEENIYNYHNEDVLKLFSDKFKIFFIDKIEDLQNYANNCDIIYYITHGKNNDFLPNNVKNVVHCVFDMSNPHGDVYAGVSESLAKKFKKTLFVPHMIGIQPSANKNDNLRKILNIPDNATVFGRYGGFDTFNLKFAINIIYFFALLNPHIYFLFLDNFFEYIPNIQNISNIIILDKIIITYELKNKFINTCDAYLECGTLGHSFGLSIGEFSVNNKPIITYTGKDKYTYHTFWNNSHIDILGDKGIYYNNENEFYNILKTFNPKDYINKDMNCYKEYTPEKVMKKFKEVFIDS